MAKTRSTQFYEILQTMKKGNPAVKRTIMMIAQDREMEVSASSKIRALRQSGHQGLGLPILMGEYF